MERSIVLDTLHTNSHPFAALQVPTFSVNTVAQGFARAGQDGEGVLFRSEDGEYECGLFPTYAGF